MKISWKGEALSLAMLAAMFILAAATNWFIGIRTPWTLSSEESWHKTHRLGGRLFVICGAVIIVASLLAPERGRLALFGAMMPAILVTVTYSYFAWRSDPQRMLRDDKPLR